MKNILYIHSGAELYGADQILLKIVTNIDKKKYRPIVLLPNDGPLVEMLKRNEIETRIIDYPIVRRKFFTPKGIISYIKGFKKSCKDIIEVVKQENIDIIHNNTIAVLEGAYIKKKTGKKLIIHIHEMIEKPKIVAKFLYKYSLKNADKVIVVSNAVKQHIESLVSNKKKNIEVLHNGIEIDLFSKNNDYKSLYDEFCIPRDSIVVGMIGRINAIKGQNDFVNAMSKIIKEKNNVYGLIVGDAFPGQEWRVDELNKTIEELNLKEKIIYTGFRKDIKEIQNLLDIYVLPSIKKDSFPTVVLEAMASSSPIVAYRCGGVEEMVKDNENGYLIEIGNKEELSNKIQFLINNKEIRKKMSEKSFEIVNKEFTIDRFIINLESIYDYME